MRRALIAGSFVLATAVQVPWLVAGPAVAAPVGPARVTSAAESALVYNYRFAGTKGTVSNSAPGGPAVRLKLRGDWSKVHGGVHFAGNTTGKESVAAGKPTHGYTFDAPAADTVGFGARIRYQKAATCSTVTPNVTQVGRYAVGAVGSQAKLQLSDCASGHGKVFVQCRFSGSASPPNAPPVTGKTALVNGAEYNLICVKTPDGQHHTVVTVRVTRLSSGVTHANQVTVGPVGSMRTTEYLSAGNKFPLPKPAHNDSQFVGDMSQAVYCVGSSSAVQRCLAANLPS